MQDLLEAKQFNQSRLNEVADFTCGSESWAVAQANWIKERALATIEKYGNEVWLYYNELDDLVGFGSLGTTNVNYPPPDGKKQTLSIIPSLAIKSEFQGHPVGAERRYSHELFEDLLAKAQDKDPDLLLLYVHKDNQKAISFYSTYKFSRLGDIHYDNIKMFLRLR